MAPRPNRHPSRIVTSAKQGGRNAKPTLPQTKTPALRPAIRPESLTPTGVGYKVRLAMGTSNVRPEPPTVNPAGCDMCAAPVTFKAQRYCDACRRLEGKSPYESSALRPRAPDRVKHAKLRGVGTPPQGTATCIICGAPNPEPNRKTCSERCLRAALRHSRFLVQYGERHGGGAMPLRDPEYGPRRSLRDLQRIRRGQRA